MRKPFLCALALAAVAASSAYSADVLMPTNITMVNALAGTPTFKYVGKGVPVPFPLPPGPDDPTVGGATLTFTDTGLTGGGGTFALPAAGWKGLGNPPGSKGFKYKGAGSLSDPCKVAIIKTNVVKAVCKSTGAFSGPVAGTLAMKITSGTGTRYCAECGGTVLKNQPGLFKAKQCPPPGSCFGSPSGAFLSDPGLF